MGPLVEEFEQELAVACQREHAAVVSSGTAALHLALLALGIGAGDEVVVPDYTFPATANVVALTGARPVLVDVDPATMNVEPALVADAVTDRTRAVLVVHLFGRPAPWEELHAALPERVVLLEDAAAALGARRQGRPCGGLGRIGCLSFHPRKIVTTGEGGAVICEREEDAVSVRSFRHHGILPGPEFDISRPGFNYRLADINCAVGLGQLRRLDQLLAERRRLAAAYAERLQGLDLDLPSVDPGDEHGWQAYVVQLERRDDALAALRAAGIEGQIGTYALHRLRAFADQGPFPGADACYERALAIPFHTQLTDSDLDRIAETLKPLA
jgi:dTDP-4-amino-4,6-dideoxygalactose transaminase